jgi:hypothetical protein
MLSEINALLLVTLFTFCATAVADSHYGSLFVARLETTSSHTSGNFTN